MKRSWAVGLGVTLGSGVIFPLILHFFSTYSINRNDAAKAVPAYMQNSISIIANIAKISEPERKSITIRYTKRGDDEIEMLRQYFYLPRYKKFFVYEQYDLSLIDRMADEDSLINENIMIRINKDDLANPKMGSAKNPVPVFNIWKANPLFIKNAQTGKQDTLYPSFNQNQYKYNLRMYLTFVMPKDEFKDRFGNLK